MTRGQRVLLWAAAAFGIITGLDLFFRLPGSRPLIGGWNPLAHYAPGMILLTLGVISAYLALSKERNTD